MTIPHQVELFIVTAKDKRPKSGDVKYVTTEPHFYLTHAKKSGRCLLFQDSHDLYVFRVQVPLNVPISTPIEVQDTLPYASLLGVYGISEPEKIKFIKCGKWRFKNTSTLAELPDGTTVSLYPPGTRLS